MENNYVAMVREVEKLRAELTNASQDRTSGNALGGQYEYERPTRKISHLETILLDKMSVKMVTEFCRGILVAQHHIVEVHRMELDRLQASYGIGQTHAAYGTTQQASYGIGQTHAAYGTTQQASYGIGQTPAGSSLTSSIWNRAANNSCGGGFEAPRGGNAGPR